MREKEGSAVEAVGVCERPQEHEIVRAREREIVLGSLVGLTDSGAPLVSFRGSEARAAVRARSLIDLGVSDLGREVALMFDKGDPDCPVVLGVVRVSSEAAGASEVRRLKLDGEEVVISARSSITLQCGKSSISLTKAGKIIIRGAYVTSRSSGVNSIKGGSVQIN